MSAERAKGTRFESEVVAYLREFWPDVERRAPSGAADKGDIAGVPAWCLECKANRGLDIARAVDQSVVEAANAGAPHALAILKRRGKGASEAYAVMPLANWVSLARALQMYRERVDKLAAASPWRPRPDRQPAP